MASSASSSLDRRANTAAAEDAPWPPVMEELYERLEKLGSSDRVYKARERADGRIVAVKQISGSSCDGPFIDTGFPDLAREVTCLNSCSGHPSIVGFRNLHADTTREDDDGDCFIVMEYGGRMSLRGFMVNRFFYGLRPLREAGLRHIMRQLLDAVDAVHRAGVVHRDLKPESVLVDDATADRFRNLPPRKNADDDVAGGRRQVPAEEIQCKICGFGSSEPIATPAAGCVRRRRDSWPTWASYAYRAPELFLGSTDYDGRVDSWGLGCIMAELLVGTGSSPFFRGKTEDDVLANMLEVVGAAGIKDWLRRRRPYMPAGSRAAAAEKLVRRCPRTGRLRKIIPENFLSRAGFQVLRGLLESSPLDRLTAREALQQPWFAIPDDELPDGGDDELPEGRRGGVFGRLLGACFMSCATDD
ncbi:unnamed protein product [Urochloa humidicola]